MNDPASPSAPSPALPDSKNSREALRLLVISSLAAAIGITAGFVAYALYNLIGLSTNIFFFQRFAFGFTAVTSNHLGVLVIVIPVIGGLIVGLMAKYGSPKIKGHGIPEAMEAVLISRSRIEPKVAILKPLSAAIAIGTGGPFGAEGPIIQTGGALGSLVGQALHTTATERKVLLACGAAAGMAATFSTPIAGVILAIELLLFEFKTRSFIPLVIASTLATSIHIWLMGPGPMFTIGSTDFNIQSGFIWYILLGILCGFAAVGLTKLLYLIEDGFDKLKPDELWHPAIGAVALGICGFFVPRIFGVGYDTISDILNDRLPLMLLLSILIFKSLALVISLGSGTSGGLLAPTFMVSAALGAMFATIVNTVFPGFHLSPGAFALVAMGAVFGAASRATFTFIIFAFEITRDYNSVLPLMLVGVIADGIGILFLKNSIMTEKLARRGLRVNAEYEPDVLHHASVVDVMDANPPTIPADMTIAQLADNISQGNPFYLKHHAFPILDGNGSLAGIITRGDVIVAMENNDTLKTVLEFRTGELITAWQDEPLSDAVNRMLLNEVGRLPVVERDNPRKLVGYLGRANILEARARRLKDENVREEGWLKRKRKNARSTLIPENVHSKNKL